MSNAEIDLDRIDDAVLALLYLTLHDHNREFGTARAWKGFDWKSLGRLHEKGLILDPVGKTKSVILTEEGLRACKTLFHALFAKVTASAD